MQYEQGSETVCLISISKFYTTVGQKKVNMSLRSQTVGNCNANKPHIVDIYIVIPKKYDISLEFNNSKHNLFVQIQSYYSLGNKPLQLQFSFTKQFYFIVRFTKILVLLYKVCLLFVFHFNLIIQQRRTKWYTGLHIFLFEIQ